MPPYADMMNHNPVKTSESELINVEFENKPIGNYKPKFNGKKTKIF